MATRVELSTDAAMVDQAPRALAEKHGFTVSPRTGGGYMARDRDGMAIRPEPFATEAAAGNVVLLRINVYLPLATP